VAPGAPADSDHFDGAGRRRAGCDDCGHPAANADHHFGDARLVHAGPRQHHRQRGATHIQGSLSATQDQMTWVLTSYIIAAAVMTPLSGWLASRFGRKSVFLISIVGFTIASALCGVAQSLPQIVLARLLQGCAARRSSRCRRRCCSTSIRRSATRKRWRSGSWRHPRPDPGPRARRLAHRKLRLALGVLYQRALRRSVLPGRPGFLSETPIRRLRFDFVGFTAISLAIVPSS